MPQPSSYYVSRPLSNFATGYGDQTFIAEQVFPVAPVDDPQGFYWAFGKEIFTAEDDYVADRARANAVESEFSRLTYATRPYALNHDVSWKERDAAARSGTAINPYRRATRVVTGKLALGRELAVANVLRSTTLITQNVTLTSGGTGTRFDEYASANSDPVASFITGRRVVRASTASATGLTAIIPYDVWEKIRFHPKVLGYLSDAATRILTTDIFAQLIGVDRILTPDSLYNTANPGQTASLTDVWGKDCMVVRIGSGANLDEELNLGRIFRLRWDSVGGLTAEARRWAEEDRKVDVVEVGFEEDRKLVAPEAAYLIKTAIS